MVFECRNTGGSVLPAKFWRLAVTAVMAAMVQKQWSRNSGPETAVIAMSGSLTIPGCVGHVQLIRSMDI